jgi:hypothetical protein
LLQSENFDDQDSGLVIVSNNDTPESQLKSPFKSILRGFKSKKHESAQKSVSWERLPAFIPKNSVLIGDFSNNIITVLPPEKNINSFLVCKDSKIQWNKFCENMFEWKI